MNRIRGLPAFAKVVGLIVIACTLTVVGIALAWRNIRNDEDHRVCMRSVLAREDNRAMWDYLITNIADPANPKVGKFRSELDERLPHLHCDLNNHPIPLEAP